MWMTGRCRLAAGAAHQRRNLGQPENNGLLYHSHGKPGAVWGTWSRSVEFEIMTGSVGMVVPVGQWNTLDLYVVGDRAIHVVNGVPVMEVRGICEPEGGNGRCVPLTHGAIQLQSEGAETFSRSIRLEPIDHLPVIAVRQ
jgi:hypothetical protein